MDGSGGGGGVGGHGGNSLSFTMHAMPVVCMSYILRPIHFSQNNTMDKYIPNTSPTSFKFPEWPSIVKSYYQPCPWLPVGGPRPCSHSPSYSSSVTLCYPGHRPPARQHGAPVTESVPTHTVPESVPTHTVTESVPTHTVTESVPTHTQ